MNLKIIKLLRSSSNWKENKSLKKTDIDSLEKFIKINKLILKTQQRFKSERHNVFTEKNKKIALIFNDDKKIQSIDAIETYAYRSNKDLLCKKEESKCNNIMKQYKNG